MNSIVFLLVLLLIAPLQAYNSTVALELVYMSKVAYRDLSAIKAWNCEVCDKYKPLNVTAFNKNNCQGFTAYSPTLDAIILSIRGSENINNWITNAQFTTKTYSRCSNCKVHKGFMKAYGQIKSDIISSITNLRNIYKDKKIYITGHSLGGAIGVLAAPDIKDQFGSVQSIVTFGQPRVGNAQFASWFKPLFTYERVVHYHDIVPHLPAKILGFAQAGRMVWYDDAMKTYKICEQGDTKGCKFPDSQLSLTDHPIDQYLKLKVETPLAHLFSLRRNQ